MQHLLTHVPNQVFNGECSVHEKKQSVAAKTKIMTIAPGFRSLNALSNFFPGLILANFSEGQKGRYVHVDFFEGHSETLLSPDDDDNASLTFSAFVYANSNAKWYYCSPLTIFFRMGETNNEKIVFRDIALPFRLRSVLVYSPFVFLLRRGEWPHTGKTNQWNKKTNKFQMCTWSNGNYYYVEEYPFSFSLSLPSESARAHGPCQEARRKGKRYTLKYLRFLCSFLASLVNSCLGMKSCFFLICQHIFFTLI